jgi:microcin C transport system permease protein
MGAYILRRILLMIPTLFGIMVVSFIVVQFAPGGPVEQYLAQVSGMNSSISDRVTGSAEGDFAGQQTGENNDTNENRSGYRGSRGLSPEFIARIEKQFGFDKPPLERFGAMLWNYLRFDFGKSYYRDISVVDLVLEKMPVSITLGLWMTILSYAISVPLGIAKAMRDGSRFDVWTSGVVIVGYAVPGFLVAILLIILFAGGSFWNLFPLRGLVSEGWARMPWPEQILDYLWHITLPMIAMALGAFATTTLLTKNAFLDEIRKQYVMTARAKGLTERRVLYGHVFRNAMLLLIASFPAAFIGAFFGGSLLIETIFSLDGLGLLGFNSVINRDYPVIFATLYIFSLLGLVIGLVSDLTYMWIDPRIDFESRKF